MLCMKYVFFVNKQVLAENAQREPSIIKPTALVNHGEKGRSYLQYIQSVFFTKYNGINII